MTHIAVLQEKPRVADRLYLGIDGGGTKCRAILVDGEGRLRGEGLGGSANAFNDAAGTCLSIVTAAKQALASAGLDESKLRQLHVGAGLAGVNIQQAHDAMMAWQHPFVSFHVMSDLKAACLGAHAGRSGRVIILGTGSCGALLEGDEFIALGGHGLALGDDASGAWLGREGIRALLLAKDGVTQPTLLSQLLPEVAQQVFDVRVEDWVGFMQYKSTADFAKLSFAVIEAARLGDHTARQILDVALNYVSRLAQCLAERASQERPLALLGGLVPYLEPELRKCLSFIEAAYPPEIGALLIPEFDHLNHQ